MQCPNCKKKIDATSKFCEFCEAKLNGKVLNHDAPERKTWHWRLRNVLLVLVPLPFSWFVIFFGDLSVDEFPGLLILFFMVVADIVILIMYEAIIYVIYGKSATKYIRSKDDSLTQDKEELDRSVDLLVKNAFPEGPDQDARESEEVNALFGNKYDAEKLQKVYFHAVMIFVASDDKSENAIIESILQYPWNILDEEDAHTLFRYIRTKLTRQTIEESPLGKLIPDSFMEEGARVLFGGNEGCNTDEIPWGKGNFGYEPTNPIPTAGTYANEVYLDRLRSLNGEIVQWERTGSCSAPNIEKPIDEYEIFNSSGQIITKLYISPYHRKTSEKAPDGFSLDK
jgi:hypothetical protein